MDDIYAGILKLYLHCGIYYELFLAFLSVYSRINQRINNELLTSKAKYLLDLQILMCVKHAKLSISP